MAWPTFKQNTTNHPYSIDKDYSNFKDKLYMVAKTFSLKEILREVVIFLFWLNLQASVDVLCQAQLVFYCLYHSHFTEEIHQHISGSINDSILSLKKTLPGRSITNIYMFSQYLCCFVDNPYLMLSSHKESECSLWCFLWGITFKTTFLRKAFSLTPLNCT